MFHKMTRQDDISLETLEKKSYSEIKDQIQPLDLLLFRGKGKPSEFIQWLQETTLGNGFFSHCGMVVTHELMPWLKYLEPDTLYVWESTMSIPIGDFVDGVVDVETGKGKFGVQIRSLEDVVKAYTDVEEESYVAWTPLKTSPWTNMDRKSLQKTMKKLHKQIGTKTYELNFLELLASIIPCLRRLRNKAEWIEDKAHHALRSWNLVDSEDEDTDMFYFCSELVARIYQSVGVIDATLNPSDVLPMDFLGYDKDGMALVVDRNPTILLPSRKSIYL